MSKYIYLVEDICKWTDATEVVGAYSTELLAKRHVERSVSAQMFKVPLLDKTFYDMVQFNNVYEG